MHNSIHTIGLSRNQKAGNLFRSVTSPLGFVLWQVCGLPIEDLKSRVYRPLEGARDKLADSKIGHCKSHIRKLISRSLSKDGERQKIWNASVWENTSVASVDVSFVNQQSFAWSEGVYCQYGCQNEVS